MDVEEYAWVKASDYRENILLALDTVGYSRVKYFRTPGCEKSSRSYSRQYEDKPRTPKELSEMTDYYLSHVSNVLSDLDDNSLAECITPDRKKGRLWRATEKGEKIIADLKR